MNKPPAFQFYPKDFLSSSRVAMMSADEVGAYILLLCYDWDNDGVPDDDDALLRLSRLSGENKGGLRVVKGCFNQHPTKDGFLTNPRLQAERDKQQKWREKSRQGGLKSSRKGTKNKVRVVEGSLKGGSRVVEPNGNTASASADCIYNTPLPPLKGGNAAGESAVVPPLTLEDATMTGDMLGIPEDVCRQWWLDRDADNWTRRNGQPITKRSTQSDLQAYWTRYQANNHQRAAGGTTAAPKARTAWHIKEQITAAEDLLKDATHDVHIDGDRYARRPKPGQEEQAKALKEQIRNLKTELTTIA